MELGRSPARPGTAAYKPDAFSGSPSRAKNEQQRRVGHRIGQHLGGIENRDPSCAACLKVYMVMTDSVGGDSPQLLAAPSQGRSEIGRATCRERGGPYV